MVSSARATVCSRSRVGTSPHIRYALTNIRFLIINRPHSVGMQYGFVDIVSVCSTLPSAVGTTWSIPGCNDIRMVTKLSSDVGRQEKPII